MSEFGRWKMKTNAQNMQRMFFGAVLLGGLGSAISMALGIYQYMPYEQVMKGIWISWIISGLGAIGWLAFWAKSKLTSEETRARMYSVSETTNQTFEHDLRSVVQKLVSIATYLFTFEGQITRLPFFVGMLVNGLIWLLFVMSLLSESTGLTFSMLLAACLSIAQSLAFVVRRTRDTGVNQWWFLMLLK